MSIRFDRLAMIAEDVRRAPPSRFNMNSWCGTQACAIGWHIQMHPDCGLEMRNDGRGVMPVFGEVDGLHGVALYLGLPPGDVGNLFGYCRYSDNTDREEVAQRIEEYIRDHRESPVIEMKADAPAPVAARQLEGESV